MNKLFFIGSALLGTAMAHADSNATLTCVGEKIILKEKSPYLGENSSFSQRLFVLKLKEENDLEIRNTAYFLKIEDDVGKFGIIYISGTNEVGGSFDLVTSHPVDESDGTTFRRVSEGTLSYSHGPLKGNKQKVKCIEE